MFKNISVIAAVSQNGVYGEEGKIPWSIPEDLAHFKRKTEGSTIVMGRSTWDSLPEKMKPLPNRENIVITSSNNLEVSGVIIVRSVPEAVDRAGHQKIFFIGGLSPWYLAMEFATEVWVTVVKKNCPISRRTTTTAIQFLDVEGYWPEFQLEEKSLHKSSGIDALEFELRYFKRHG